MATLRELKGRIGSVASSEKITGAMKMISSAKMHKAESELKQQLPFRSQIETIIGNLLSADAAFSSSLLVAREVKSVTVVVWGSDEGLCGAYNVNIFKNLVARISELRAKYGSDIAISIIPVGSKIAKIASKMASGKISVAPVEGIDSKAQGAQVKEFMNSLIARFTSGETDMVSLLYMQYKSVSRQTLTFEEFLPVESSAFSGMTDKAAANRPYIFEPDATTIFSEILPLYLLSVMTEIFTENRASQQAARVMAMQSANDNAKKLLDQLKLEFNKLRQQSITTELLDIVGGQVR